MNSSFYKKYQLFFNCVAFFFALAALSFCSVYSSEHFDQQKEFPNLFLPKQYQNENLVPDHIIEQQKNLIEQVMLSIFNRSELRIYNEDTDAFETIRYFSYIDKKIKQLDPNVEVGPSGGVIRSTIGYIYN